MESELAHEPQKVSPKRTINLSSDDHFPSLLSSNSKKAKRQENKAKKLHAYYELIKDKQPTSFENNKLSKPASNSEHTKPRFIIETDDLIPPPLGKFLSQSVQLRSTLHTLGVLHPVGASAKMEEQKRREERKTAIIHPFDVQRLVLRALLGNVHKPRWCKLKCQKRLAKVVCVVVDRASAADWYRHKGSCPNLTKLSRKEGAPVELNVSTSGDAENLRRLLHSVPLTISDLRQFNEGVIAGCSVPDGEEGNEEEVWNEDGEVKRGSRDFATETYGGKVVDASKDESTSLSFPACHWKKRLLAKTIDPVAKHALESDGIVTWVDLTRHSDVFKRTYLLLDTNEMIADNIPTPHTVRLGGESGEKSGYWALGQPKGDEIEISNDCEKTIDSSDIRRDIPSSEVPFYLPVTSSSPLFAIDVEMCRGADGTLLPVWIAVVDENLRHLYSSLIKPAQPIVDYLTQYSGVSKATLKDVTTTMDDVARDLRRLLPGDAVLVGHQIGCDLESLKLVHPYVVDTAKILNLKGDPDLKSKLRDLTRNLLGRNIQEFSANGSAGTESGVNGFCSSSSSSSTISKRAKLGHDPVEDARATMELVLLKLRNHPMFGNLGFPAGVMPEEWQTMPVKFLKWYARVAASQKTLRLEMNARKKEEEEDETTAGKDANGTGRNSAETAISFHSQSNGHHSANINSNLATPSSTLRKVLTLADEEDPVSPSITSSSSSLSSNSSPISRPPIASEKRLTLEQAFDLTSRIFPSSDVGDLLAQDGKYSNEFTVESEAEITLDRMQGGCYKYTSFVIKDSRHLSEDDPESNKEDFLRRVDRCVAKIVEYLPKLSLIVVVFSGKISRERRGGERKGEDANGLVLVDIV